MLNFLIARLNDKAVRKVILNSALSLDSFIARPDGNVDWLHDPAYETPGEDYGLGDFYKSVDTTLMGNSTYKAILGFDVPFPYPDKTNYVFTRSPDHPDTEHVRFVSGDVVGFVNRLKEDEGRDIWLVGGGRLNATLLESGLIDGLHLTIVPVILGQGIPLFAGRNAERKFRLISSHAFDSGLVQLILEK